MKTLYTAHAIARGGRNGHTETSDGTLKLDLATPGAPNAKPGTTNPEQLFASGYAACFGSAIEFVAKQKQLDASDVAVNADISLNQDESGFFISVVLRIDTPMPTTQAMELVAAAHQVCPYSKATRGNVQVDLRVNGEPLERAAA